MVPHKFRTPSILARIMYLEPGSKQMSLPKNLPGLPGELVSKVCAFVPKMDILRLRLVCKKLRDKALYSFGQTFFAHRRHVISHYSLEALIGISAHPHLGHFVRRLGFNCVMIPKPDSDMVGYSNGGAADPISTKSREHHLFLLDPFRPMLIQVLNNLRRFGHDVTIHVIANHPCGHGYGWRELLGSDDELLCEVAISPASEYNTYLREVLSSCARAVRAAEIPVHNVLLDFPDRIDYPILSTVQPMSYFAAHNGGIAGARLTVRFFRHQKPGCRGIMYYDHETRDLECDLGFLVGSGFDDLVDWVDKNSLDSLSIRNANLNWHDLQPLLARNTPLEHLIIQNVNLKDQEDWIFVFAWITGNLTYLNYCFLTGLSYEKQHLNFCNDELIALVNETYEFEGRGEVKRGLQRMEQMFRPLESNWVSNTERFDLGPPISDIDSDWFST